VSRFRRALAATTVAAAAAGGGLLIAVASAVPAYAAATGTPAARHAGHKITITIHAPRGPRRQRHRPSRHPALRGKARRQAGYHLHRGKR
jgi:hypothetical protein